MITKEYLQRRALKIARNKARRIVARKRMKNTHWFEYLLRRAERKEEVAKLEEIKKQKRLEMGKK